MKEKRRMHEKYVGAAVKHRNELREIRVSKENDDTENKKEDVVEQANEEEIEVGFD